MKRWKNRILQAKFGRLAKRLAIVSICTVLLGGILSAVLLQPQISQAASALQQAEHDDSLYREHPCGWNHLPGIKEPAPPAEAALLAIGAAFCVLLAMWWLLVPAWLYQASSRARMNTTLWPLLGLLWNLWGLLLFLAVRGLFRQRCGVCGTWQSKAAFCRACGAKFHTACPSCGTNCSPDDSYCSHCGSALNPVEDLNAAEGTR